MIVKDIIKETAKLLDLRAVLEYLDNLENEVSSVEPEELNSLLLAINVVNNLLASQYYELIEIEKFNCKNGEILLGDFSRDVLEIKKVFDNAGHELSYKLHSNKLCCDTSIFTVEYSYLPSTVNMDSNIDYYTKMSLLIFAIGVAGEYLFLNGNFDESVIWDAKFKNILFGMNRPKRSIVLKAKRWF